jgi:uncharacterized tellurite resistance protein B-like protein
VSLFQLLGFGKPAAESNAAQTDTVRKIVAALDRLDPAQARYLAAFAYVMSRVARADLTVAEAETRTMEQVLMEQAGLNEEQAILTVQMAKHHNLLFGATEDFLVTREFNKITTAEQRLELLDRLFRVAAAEGRISVKEDNEIRQIARELGLSHQDFIAVRLRFRDQLAVLQPAEPRPERGA